MSDSLADETSEVENTIVSIDNVDDGGQKPEVLSTNNIEIAEQSTGNIKDIGIQKGQDNTEDTMASESIESVENSYNKESATTESETTTKHNTDTENETPDSVDAIVESTKPKSFEIVQSVKSNPNATESLKVSDDVDKETVSTEQSSTQALSEISKSIKSSDVEGQSSETSTDSSSFPSKDVDYAEHVTYKQDGSAIYTDPQTKYQYKWCTDTNNWTPCVARTESSSTTSDPYENEHYKWCPKTQKWIAKQTQVTETEHYKWDPDKEQWMPKIQKEAGHDKSTEIVYDIDEDGQRTYTDKDGTVFFWDASKSAWFPKIDEDFMARYQMSYGFIDNTSEAKQEKEEQESNEMKRKQEELEKLTEEAKTNDEAAKGSAAGVKRKVQQEPPKWFEMDPSRNTKVYVSNLPLDITLDEFAELMGKCGMIMRDPLNQKFKLKLYTEADGQIKGDGLCDYIKVESVDLALKILDEYDLRGNKIRVQQAQFQMRGEYNPALKPKRKKKDKEKLAKIKEKLFDWRPEKMRGERSKHDKTVIIKNLFHPELFEKEVQLILDYQNDLREECSKCGTVKKVVIYDRHSEGVAQINMTSPEEADVVIQMMQGRFFGKRQLTAEHWDGKTKYKVEETEEEIQKRLNKWDQYLERTEEQKQTKEPAIKTSEEKQVTQDFEISPEPQTDVSA